MTILITPLGGLGNQLFIYAAGKELSRRYKTPLMVSRTSFNELSLRMFELDSFESDFAEVSRAHRSLLNLSNQATLAIQKGRQLAKASVRGRERALDPAFLYKPLPQKKSQVLPAGRYFQSWRYFPEVADEIRKETQKIRNPTPFYEELRKDLDAATKTVAVHVRRGDYLTNEYMGNVPEDYYLRALEMLLQLVGNFRILLFSDDPNVLSARKFLSEWRDQIRLVEPPPNSRPIESLNLMARCDHVVMANSSFSWWGAWLGERSGRTVIYPRPWLKGAWVDDRDLALPGWISLGGM